MPEHVDLTDPELHEPKGAAAASFGMVYVADGANSGGFEFLLTRRKFINELSDLPTPSAGVITLAANTQYVLGNDINIGTDRLVLGDNTELRGIGSLPITLTYTGSGDMITMADVTARVSHLTISCASGRIYNWSCTAVKIFRCHDVSVTACDKIGVFNGVDGIIRFTAFSPATVTTDGMEFLGDFRSFLYEVSATTVEAGAVWNIGTATFDSFIVDTVLLTLNGTSFAIDGTTGSANINTGGNGLVSRLRISGTGTPLNNVSVDDALWEFRGNDDIADTRPDGLLSMQGNTTNTVIASAGVGVLTAGTFVVERTSQFDGTVSGRLTYKGGKTATLPIAATITIEPAAGTNKEVGAFVAKNGTTIANSKVTTFADAGAPGNITLLWQDALDTNDYIEVFLVNETDTTDVLASHMVTLIN